MSSLARRSQTFFSFLIFGALVSSENAVGPGCESLVSSENAVGPGCESLVSSENAVGPGCESLVSSENAVRMQWVPGVNLLGYGNFSTSFLLTSLSLFSFLLGLFLNLVLVACTER